MRILIDHGADFNQLDDEMCSPLHVAAREGREDICKVLIEAGSKVVEGQY